MSYLWAGGEDIDFPVASSVNTTTTGGRFRSGFARCGISCSGSSIGNASASTPFPGGAVTSCWLSCQAWNFASNSSQNVIGLGQSGQGSKGIFIGTTSGSSTLLNLFLYNGSTITVLASSGSIGLQAGLSKVDIQIVNYGASATVNVFINGGLAITYSGNIAIAGITGFDTVLLPWLNTNNMAISEVIVATADTRSVQGLVTLAPNGNGTTQSWSNPAFTNFNPTTINDANSTFVNATGQDEQATLSDLPAGNFSVPVVKVSSRAMASTGSASANLQQGFNNGGTVAVGSSHALTTAFATYEDYFTNDPTTALAWVVSQLNALQLDLRSA